MAVIKKITPNEQSVANKRWHFQFFSRKFCTGNTITAKIMAYSTGIISGFKMYRINTMATKATKPAAFFCIGVVVCINIK